MRISAFSRLAAFLANRPHRQPSDVFNEQPRLEEALRQSEERFRMQSAILQAVNRILGSTLKAQTVEELGRLCLAIAEEVTESKISFVGEIGADGSLRDIAISNPGWDVCRIHDQGGQRKPRAGLPIHGIYGRVLIDRKSLISNDPAVHPDRVGLPEGHPPVTCFLGVPLLYDSKIVGMIGVANREGGYRLREQEALEALAPALAAAIAQKRAEEALKASERVYRAIGESIDYGIWICDAQGRNTYASESFLRLVGITQEQCAEFGWGDILHPEDAEDTINAWKECARRGTYWYREHRCKGVDGLWHPVLACGVPVRDESGEITCWAGINLDISRLKQAEERLVEADRRKDEFLAILAHELRNPMAAISAASTLLSRPGIDAEKAQIAKDSLKRRTEQLGRLVEDLLDVSRIVRGKIELKRQSLDLESVISQAAEAARGYFEEREQQLIVRVVDVLPVYGDPIRLEQIVTNLLTNASRYSDNGQEVCLSAFRDKEEVVIQVKDRGAGIRADLLATLFEPFAQAEQPLARSRGGLGLGLTIVKRLCELHGGRVLARSDGEGEGSEFEVRLPIGEAHQRLETSAEAGAAKQLRILLVEDHPDTALMQAAMLELEGHVVDMAGDGHSAVEKALATRPDVILLDIGLPGLNGYEVARRLRAGGLIGTLLIALTGYGQERDILKAQEAGIDHHVLKPIDYEKLAALLAARNIETVPTAV